MGTFLLALIWKDLVIVTPGGELGAVQPQTDPESGLEVRLPGGRLLVTFRADFWTPNSDHRSFGKSLPWIRHGRPLGNPWKIFSTTPKSFNLSLCPKTLSSFGRLWKGSERWTLKPASGRLIRLKRHGSQRISKASSPTRSQGRIHLWFNENSFTCLDASDGQLKWRGNKYGYGRVLLAGDKLVILGSTGVLSVVEANPEKFVETYSGQLLGEARCWNGQPWSAVTSCPNGRNRLFRLG